jgi:hypothetical protein
MIFTVCIKGIISRKLPTMWKGMPFHIQTASEIFSCKAKLFLTSFRISRKGYKNVLYEYLMYIDNLSGMTLLSVNINANAIFLT